MDSPLDQPDSPQPIPPADSTAAPGAEGVRHQLERLDAQYQFLETIFALTVSALVLMAVGIDLYIFKQMRLARAQAQRQRQLIQPALESFHKDREPLIRSFLNKLQTFAATDEDFQPILEKYRKELGFYFLAPPSTAQSAQPEPSPGATNP